MLNNILFFDRIKLMFMEENYKKLDRLFNKYKLSREEINEIMKVIKPIFEHREFQKRMEKDFLHHSDITLGEHILEDTIVTYRLAKKKKCNVELALKISMLHDLYTSPWQNSERKVKHFFNKHGFTHPLEAVINSYNWFPNLFANEKESKIIIDGILHHMFPLPVRRINYKELELNNLALIDNLPSNIKNDIIISSKRKRIKGISFSRSLYKEGKIMSKADKRVSIRQIKNFYSFTSLFTGKNKSIKK